MQQLKAAMRAGVTFQDRKHWRSREHNRDDILRGGLVLDGERRVRDMFGDSDGLMSND